MITPAGSPTGERASSARRLRAGATANASKTLRRRKECRYRIGTISNTDVDCHSDSISPSPPHGQDTRGCRQSARITRDWRLSATHPCRRSFGTARRIRSEPGSHLGSTLRSGRAVLTGGVSRRSGSVACIHADASPTEVLANPSWHRNQCPSNILAKNSPSFLTVDVDQPSRRWPGAVGDRPISVRFHLGSTL